MAARRYWFVLMAYGAALALSLPLYLRPGEQCVPGTGCGVGISSPVGVLGSYELARPGVLQLYWAVALLLTTAAATWWYRRAGRLGRALPALVTAGVVSLLTVVLTAAEWHGFRSPSAVVETAELLLFNGATPLVVSALALLALAAGERSAALAAFAVLYGGVAYVAATYDSLYVLSGLGLPVDVFSDPAGVRQLLGIAAPAALLLLAAGAAWLLPGRQRSIERPSSITA
ncbi:hypothetical protein [Kitasatospora sp. McL0602]|uniref:hypothetical protein n=1 Tax=Kitasatospora sp. McL0602 TaxID=3439530 RepID=UPI003F890EC0